MFSPGGRLSVDLGFNTDAGETRQPIELSGMLMKALKSGELRAYDKDKMLISPAGITTSELGIFVFPPEVNSWMKKMNLPYRWDPAPQKKRVGRPREVDAIGNRRGELQKDADKVQTSQPGILLKDVAKKLANTSKWSPAKASSILKLIYKTR